MRSAEFESEIPAIERPRPHDYRDQKEVSLKYTKKEASADKF